MISILGLRTRLILKDRAVSTSGDAEQFVDYRELIDKMGDKVDAIGVSTPVATCTMKRLPGSACRGAPGGSTRRMSAAFECTDRVDERLAETGELGFAHA